MSKTFWAGLRIGWVRANPALVRRLAAARAALDISQPGARAADRGRAARGRRSGARAPARRRPRAPRRVRRERCASTCPSGASRVPAGGLSLWVELDAPRSTALAAIADRHGLRLAAGPRFGVDGAFERYLRLPYSLPAPVLEDAAARLARRVARGHRSPPPPRWPSARPRLSPETRTYVRVCCATWNPPSTASRSSPRNHQPSGSAWRPSSPTGGSPPIAMTRVGDDDHVHVRHGRLHAPRAGRGCADDGVRSRRVASLFRPED